MSNIPHNFIFRLSFPCQHITEDPDTLIPEALDSSFRVPYGAHQPWGGSGGGLSTHDRRPVRIRGFEQMVMDAESGASKTKDAESGTSKTKGTSNQGGGASGSTGQESFDFRIGWHEKGILLTVILSGKNRPLFCDPSKLETSDGLYLVLDTRDVRDIQRGTRYSHRFLFFPTSTDSKTAIPKAFWLPIHRAKAQPNPVDVSRFRLASEVRKDGYSLSVFIPGETLTGFDPKEHNRLGFHYTLQDNELGHYVLQHLPLFPVEEVPSLWANLVLNP